MKQLFVLSIVFWFSHLGLAQAESLSCHEAHQEALSKCEAYKYQIGAEDLETMSVETRIRAASKEKARTFALGRNCARVQKQCSDICSQQAEETLLEGGDWALYVDLGSDCREGEVARHRSQLAKRYREFKAMASPSVSEARAHFGYDLLGY